MADYKGVSLVMYEKEKHDKHLKTIAKDMRDIDVFELLATGSDDVEAAVRESVDNSWSAFFLLDRKGYPLCVFGIIPNTIGEEVYDGNIIWCLGTKRLIKHKTAFVHWASEIISWWKREFGVLFNFISVDNDKSIKWLRTLGAEFSEPFPVGDGYLFKKFTIGGD